MLAFPASHYIHMHQCSIACPTPTCFAMATADVQMHTQGCCSNNLRKLYNSSNIPTLTPHSHTHPNTQAHPPTQCTCTYIPHTRVLTSPPSTLPPAGGSNTMHPDCHCREHSQDNALCCHTRPGSSQFLFTLSLFSPTPYHWGRTDFRLLHNIWWQWGPGCRQSV